MNKFYKGGGSIRYKVLITCMVFIGIMLSGCGAPDLTGSNNTGNANPIVVVDANTQQVNAETAEADKEEAGEVNKDSQTGSYSEYDINMEIVPELRTITGVEKITYKNNSGGYIDTIYVNVFINAFSEESSYEPYFEGQTGKIFAQGRDYAKMDIETVFIDNKEVEFLLRDTVLEIKPNDELYDGQVIEIAINFESYIPKIAHRTGANDSGMWLGQFLPVLAVRDGDNAQTNQYYGAGDPFFSEVSNYNVTVTTPKGYKVVGPGISVVTETEDKSTTQIQAKLIRNFAFAVSDRFIEESVVTDGGVIINLYRYTEDITRIDRIMEGARFAVEYFSEKIGNYPYSELNIVEAQLWLAGGMEYPKFIMIDEARFSSDDVVSTVVHEIGHQWFHGLIGSNEVEAPWLDEGIVSMLQEEALYDKETIRDNMQREYETLSERIKNGADTRLVYDLSKYDTWSEYYRANYVRGKLMIYALQQKMGEEMFDRCMKEYFKEYIFKNATPDDFFKIMKETSGESLDEFFYKWIHDLEMPPLTN